MTRSVGRPLGGKTGDSFPFERINVSDHDVHDPRFRQKLLDLTGGWTVPQILIDDEPIGGYTELWQLDRGGQLDKLAA